MKHVIRNLSISRKLMLLLLLPVTAALLLALNLIYLNWQQVQMAQQVGINLMALVRYAQRGLGNEGFDTHDFHETAHPFPSDVPTMRDEFEPELARSQERPLRVELVEDFHDRMVFAGRFGFARSEAVAVDAYQLALPAHGELGVLGIDHGLSLRSIPS